MMWRCSFRPAALTCTGRSSEGRHSAPVAATPPGSSRQRRAPTPTYMAQLELDATLRRATDPGEAELEVRREPFGRESGSRLRSRSASTPAESCQTKCGSMKSSCRRVPPQRLSGRSARPVPEAARARPRGESLLGHAHAPMRRASPEARCSQVPADRARRVGRGSTCPMQGSVRLRVAGRVDSAELRKMRSTSHGGVCRPGAIWREGDLEARAMRRCALRRRRGDAELVGPMNRPENRLGERRVVEPR